MNNCFFLHNFYIVFLHNVLFFKEYLNNLNNLRTTLPARLSHLEPAKDSVVRQVVTEVTSQYKDLLNRANALSDRLSGVGGRQREFKDALEKARAWLREAEPRATKVDTLGTSLASSEC